MRFRASGGVATRVVSMPSWELFDRESAAYRETVLPGSARLRVVVEAGIKTGWERYVGPEGLAVGMDGFGASAPAPVLYEKFGITVENVVKQVRTILKEVD